MSGQPTWKVILLRSLGIGAGFALTLSAIIGVFVWHNKSKLEKPWNQSAIKAAATETLATPQAEDILFEFRYSLENRTGRDFTLPNDSRVMVRLAQDMSYRENSEMVWNQEVYIPAGQKVNISIKLPVHYAEFNFSQQKANDEKQFSAFADKRLAEIDGFGLFDPKDRYEIYFPNGWPEAVKRAKAQDTTTTSGSPQ